MTLEILLNSKTQKPSACNSAETLLIHRDILRPFLDAAVPALTAAGVEMRGDAECRAHFPDLIQPAPDDAWDTEYLDLILSVKCVGGVDEAIDHINTHGSRHTDVIVTADAGAAAKFQAEVDSAAVMWNASTRFNDGGEFGFGCEIGISTDKLHARGPMGLPELTSYKYLVTGEGQVRA